MTRPATGSERAFGLGLGGNLGEVARTLRGAVAQLEHCLGPLTVAPLYRSLPRSPVAQPDFLNTALVGRTSLSPEAILAMAKLLEQRAGRRRGRRLGPRPLDIDLLFVGTEHRRRPELTLPHPRLAERRFVLAPLAAVAPHRSLLADGPTVAEMLAACGDEESVEEVARWPWS